MYENENKFANNNKTCNKENLKTYRKKPQKLFF